MMGVELYFRENRGYYGLSETELSEALNLYTAKIKAEIISEVIEGTTVDFRGGDFEKVISYFLDRGITKGMELALNHYDVVRYYKKVMGLSDLRVTHYDFEDGKGVSGALLPEGVFIRCGDAEHVYIMEDIPREIQYRCIYFSSKLDGISQDGIISHSPIGFPGATPEQKVWMKKNMRYFDNMQREIYKEREKHSIY